MDDIIGKIVAKTSFDSLNLKELALLVEVLRLLLLWLGWAWWLLWLR